jgi:methyl-accepting chemotaxis protein
MTQRPETPKVKTSMLEASQRTAAALIESIRRSSGVIEFAMDGTILDANPVFLDTMGYRLEEVVGQHHRIFVDAQLALSEDYRAFWSVLNAGHFHSAEYKRIARSGAEVWLQATYNPVLDEAGRPQRVVKVAHDVTPAKLSHALASGKIDAIEKSMAVIEFSTTGTIIRANELFLQMTGYTEAEVVGRHHSMFVEPAEAASEAYQTFWRELAAGKFRRGQFRRRTKSGGQLWLEATYNAILDLNGTPSRVVKFAYDVTDQYRKATLAVGEKAAALAQALEEARRAERARRELDRTVQALSTPITPLWDGVLMLPLVGIVDLERLSQALTKTLNKIAETRCRLFILDISGVPTVDHSVAQGLVSLSKAARLMGAETVISGVSPTVAASMVDLGIEVGKLRTTATLRDALETNLSFLVGKPRPTSSTGP